MNHLSYDNKQETIRNLPTPKIDSFKNIYPENNFEIKFTISEFTAICPKTSLPDFGEIYITYIPDLVCIELKSLKEYILFFRNIGIFHENVVNKIIEDIKKDIQPRYLKVLGDFNIRGGIKTTVLREFVKS